MKEHDECCMAAADEELNDSLVRTIETLLESVNRLEHENQLLRNMNRNLVKTGQRLVKEVRETIAVSRQKSTRYECAACFHPCFPDSLAWVTPRREH